MGSFDTVLTFVFNNVVDVGLYIVCCFIGLLAGYPALLGPLPLYFSLPIRYSFLVSTLPPSDYPASPRIFAV